ncbi:MAG: sulfurtransferase TusA family protein [Desulfobacteraceae bacterium]
MAADNILDLRGVITPLCLFQCKSVLKTLDKGQVLEVKLTDEDVIHDLAMIVARSGDEMLFRNETEGMVRLGIRKG